MSPFQGLDVTHAINAYVKQQTEVTATPTEIAACPETSINYFFRK